MRKKRLAPPEERGSLVVAGDNGRATERDLPEERDIPPEPTEPAQTSRTETAAPDDAVPDTQTSSSPSEGKVLELGASSGSYIGLRRIGEGGMAEVWLARHVGAAGFQRYVAVKRIRPDHLADDEDGPLYSKMFLDEAHLAAELDHPGIVQVYDLQAHSDGTYYLVMEYVAGSTLRKVLLRAARKGRRLSVGFCCHVAAQLADALHCAYNARGRDGQPLRIVHRDVNPKNIMLAESGVTKLLDFGIAYSYLQHRDRTLTGVMKGKYSYMSPEQANGNRELDNRSDVFALGIVLTEMLTGRRPFDGPSNCETKTIDKVRAAAPEDVQGVSQELPANLQAVLGRALSRDPSARFQSGAEFATALRAYMLEARLLVGPSEVVAELQALEDLPDAQPACATSASAVVAVGAPPAGSTRAPAAAEPQQNGSLRPTQVAALPPPSPQPRAPTETEVKKHLATRARLTKPQDVKRKLVKPALLILAVALAVNAAILLFTRINVPRRTHVELEKTPSQVRAEKEAEERALLPAPAAAALPVVQNAAATLATATSSEASRSAPISTPLTGTAPAPNTTRRPGRRLAAAETAGSPGKFRRRSLDNSTAMTFADAPARGGAGQGTGGLPQGTLIPARLLVPADANNPGPVTAAVTKNVEANGAVVIPEGSTLVCAASGSAAGLPRIAVSCESVTIKGQSVRLSGTGLGADHGRGIPVATLGGTGATEPARTGAISTSARVATRLVGADGILGDLVDGSVRAGEQTAQNATTPRAAKLEPAPAGTRFFVFVASFGSAP
jgi:eukaryotic-like serine/threonine-protein kinase